MMRATAARSDGSSFLPWRGAGRGSSLGLGLALGLMCTAAPIAAPLAAAATPNTPNTQDTQGGFALPTPTATQTATAPAQGPVDERMGVAIGPRVIVPADPAPQESAPQQTSPQQNAAAAPASEPASASTRTTQPAAPLTTTPSTTQSAAPTQQATRPATRPAPQPAVSAPTRSAPPLSTGPLSTGTPSQSGQSAAQSDTPGAAPINSGASGAQVTLPGNAATPGFETLPYDSGAFDAEIMDQGAIDEGTPIGPDGWYDVDQSGNRATGAPQSATGAASGQSALAVFGNPVQSWTSTRNMIAIALGIALLLVSLAALIALRRRKARPADDGDEDHRLAVGLRNSMASMMDPRPDGRPEMASDFADDDDDDDDDHHEEADAAGAGPEAAHAAGAQSQTELTKQASGLAPDPASADLTSATSNDTEPNDTGPNATEPAETQSAARVDLPADVALEIIAASRSLMMFTIDLRLDIANRSDVALRDLRIAAHLVCAQRGAGKAGAIADAHTLDFVERIGPHQSRRISGQLQLPLSEVQAIRQGAKPLFIPLLHVMVDAGEHGLLTSSFVIGTPSSASSGRVHPLPLDTVPGSMPALRGQPIKQPVSTGAAA